MVTYAGAVLTSPIQNSQWTYLADALGTHAVDYFPPHQSALSAALWAAYTTAFPVAQDAARVVAGGVVATSFGADWYSRIHIEPATINLGNLISPQARPVEVWNAYFTPQTLTAVTPVNAEGLTLSGQPAPPLDYQPLQSRMYVLDAATSGPATVDADFAFTFTSDAADLHVVGRRIIVFPARPNWSDDFLERAEWSTEVLASYDGSEQRIALLAAPRRRYEYSLLEQWTDAAYLDALLFGWSARAYCLPVWTDLTVTSAPLSAGGLSLPVPEVANQDWRADGLAVLWQSTTAHEAVEVQSVGAGTVTLKLPLSQAWPAGTRIYPARIVRLDGNARVSHATDRLSVSRIAWRCEDVDAPAAAGYGATYRDFRIFDWGPDRSADPESDWSRKIETLDYGGIVTTDDESGNPILVRRFSWLLSGRPAIAAFRAWLAERRGRLTPFWLPSFQDDLLVTAPIAAADSALRVRAIGIASLVAPSTVRQDLLIRTKSATFYRRVGSVAELSATEEGLVLDSPLGVTLQPEDFVTVQWLSLARLEADAVEIAWITDALARIELTFRVLPS